VKCPSCGLDNSALSARCARCQKLLPATAAVRGGAYLPVWLVVILMAVVASVAFWLGLSSGRDAEVVELATQRGPRPLAVLPPGAAGEDVVEGIDPVATTAGLTWSIYTSQDRLTDRPLFGARFGTVSGTPLFTVLCAESQGALSLKRGLLPAAEGASQNSKSTLDTVRVGVRIGERERDRIELRFEDAPPEFLDAIPKNPLEFLRRVERSRKIRTETDTFDPSTWGEAIARVREACGFEEKPGPAQKKAGARK